VGRVALNVFNTAQNLLQHIKPVGASLLAKKPRTPRGIWLNALSVFSDKLAF
jgi:hypothetical protein